MTILRRCRAAQADIRRLKMRETQREDAMKRIGGMRMDANGGGRGTSDPDKMGRLAAALDEAQRDTREREEAYWAEMNSTLQLLEMVPDLESGILHRYYLLEDTLAAIARALKYDESYVRKKKKDGEDALRMISAEKVDATLPGWYLRKWEETQKERKK